MPVSPYCDVAMNQRTLEFVAGRRRKRPPPDLGTVGGRLEAARRALNLGQTELAKAAGVAQSTISRYEGNVGERPRAHELAGVARVLKTTVSYILDGTIDPPMPMADSFGPRESGRDFFRATALHEGHSADDIVQFLGEVSDSMHKREENSPAWWLEFYRDEFRRWRATARNKAVGVRHATEEDDEP